MTTVLGIDPGSHATGVVVVEKRWRILEHQVLVRKDKAKLPGADYLALVVDTVAALLPAGAVIAVEGLVEPNPHMGLIAVCGVIGTAMVLGAVLTVYPAAFVVPPGGNGSSWISAYPAELRPTTGQGKGQDVLRHCRSAFDVAVAGERLAHVAGRAARR